MYGNLLWRAAWTAILASFTVNPAVAGGNGSYAYFHAGSAHVEHLATAVSGRRLWLLVAQRSGNPDATERQLRLWRIETDGRRLVDRPVRTQARVAGPHALHVDESAGRAWVGLPSSDGPRVHELALAAGDRPAATPDPDGRVGAEGRWLGFVSSDSGYPAAVTSAGVFRYSRKSGWRAAWVPEPGYLGVAMAPSPGGSPAVLVAAWRDDSTRLRVVRLGSPGGPGTLASDLGAFSSEAMYAQLVRTAKGLVAAVPVSRSAPSRWQLVPVGNDGNVGSPVEVVMAGVDSVRTRFFRHGDSLAFDIAPGPRHARLVRLDTALRVAGQRDLYGGDEGRPFRVKRVTAVADEGHDYVVLSGLARHPDEPRLRSEIIVSLQPGDVP